MRLIFNTIVCIVLLFAAIFWLQYVSILNFSFFAPKIQDAKRNVFENTQSYVEGKRQDLTNYQFEYKRAASDEDRNAICFVVRQSMANVDTSHFDAEQILFIKSCK